ncbi:cobalamin biosynthesis protein [Salininema proteolyticum]|uniref:Cobalamin biosynthesis protein CobD n=1 Tax=Salininema proteolyticum TaxID=1607685 RepID=A0ABV8U6R5_9ACTN
MRAAGIALGALADALFADPRRFHPVAGYGQAAMRLERVLYADSRAAGAVYTAVAVGVPTAAVWILQRRASGGWTVVLTAATAWAALGGRSLLRAADGVDRPLEVGSLSRARFALRSLCARDAAELDGDELAKATVESLAENTSDAVVAPLWWVFAAGPAGIAAYRAVNTLDAMVGYKTSRYRNFGWASARLDDLANVVPARISAALAAVLAPVAGGSTAEGLRVWRRDGSRHPSPNAGQVESAFAGALGLRLGGSVNSYGDAEDSRPAMGDGKAPAREDIKRARKLSWAVGAAAAGLAVAGALMTRRRKR